MTLAFENRTFADWYDQNSAKTFHDLEFRHCRFVSAALAITKKPARRSLTSSAGVELSHKTTYRDTCHLHACAWSISP